MWNRIFAASLASGVLMLSAVGGASADTLNMDQWTAFAEQQPLLSRVFVDHETTAVAKLFGISVEQLKFEMADRSLVDLAAAHNRSANDVAAVMLQTANRDLQLAATFGMISQEERADLKAQFEAVLPNLMSVPAPPVLTNS